MAAAGNNYDVIVIGAGVEGSASAYSLAKKGQRVLLLEQFDLPHSRGSSHGQSRIISLNSRHQLYVRMTLDSYPVWATLEKEFGQTLFRQCGAIDIRQEGSKGLQNLTTALQAQNAPHEFISPKDFRSRFPMFKVNSNVGCMYGPTAGVLKADRVLAAFQSVFQKMGGTIIDGCQVTSVLPGDVVTVVTRLANYYAKRVVIAAGPWTGKFTSALGLNTPLKPCRSTVFYWKASESGDQTGLHGSSHMPCFIDSSVDDDHYHCYGVPADEYPGLVKVCLHAGPACDPDHRDRADTSGVQEKAIQEIKRLLPGLEPRPSVIEYCIVTKTPDDNFYIDKHPKYPNIVIAAGFSGYGFKLAPAVAQLVTDLVLDLSPSYPMELFRVDRFNTKSKM